MERLIIYLPIEPLEERYSEQWDRWFLEEFKKQNKEIVPIYGIQKNKKINVGCFLDVVDTNRYKLSQLQQICDLISDGKLENKEVVFFFMDLWFPGLEVVAYMRDLLGKPWKITGIFHAGTYDNHDFLYQKGLNKWGKYLEKSWLEIVDEIFVATQFHKDLIVSKRGDKFKDKIVVTGLPINCQEYKNLAVANSNLIKDNIVVFPHRLDKEKQPWLFDKLEVLFKKKYPHMNHVKFLKTKEICKNKNEYYGLLSKSKASFSSALQETFGIAMIESVSLGAFPIIPNRLSYREVFDSFPRYDSLNQAVDILYDVFINKISVSDYQKYDNSLEKIVKEI